MHKTYLSGIFSKRYNERTLDEQEDIMVFMNLVIFLDMLDIKWGLIDSSHK